MWQPDETSDRCATCGIAFTFLVRKHHCRMCGKIFCCGCTRLCRLPSLVLKISRLPKERPRQWGRWWVGPTNDEPRRLCGSCAEQADYEHSIYTHRVGAFENNVHLSVTDYCRLQGVCRSWRYVFGRLLDACCRVQYLLPSQRLTNFESFLLRRNASVLRNHTRFRVQMLLRFPAEDPVHHALSSHHPVSSTAPPCSSLRCSSSCSRHLSVVDAVVLLHSHSKRTVKKAVMFLSRNMTEKWLILFCQHLVGLSINRPRVLYELLIPGAAKSIAVFYAVYFAYRSRDDDVSNHYVDVLFENVKPDWKRDLRQTCAFVRTCQALYEIYRNRPKQWRVHQHLQHNSCISGARLPHSPEVRVEKIDIHACKVFGSKTKPMKFVCVDRSTRRHVFMWKRENVRNDLLAQNVTRLMNAQFGTDLVTYAVLPLTPNEGIIGFVPDSQTVHDIRQRTTIQNYVAQHQTTRSVHDIRERFLSSVAGSSIVCHILGVGDRHLENVMIKTDGRLFHVDFGYLLGADPMGRCEIRLTEDIVETMGGIHSSYYSRFKRVCSDLFNDVRETLLNVLYYVVIDSLDDHTATVHEHFLKKLLPGESKQTALLRIVKTIETSSSDSNTVRDTSHNLANYFKSWL